MTRSVRALVLGLFLAGVACLTQAQMPNVRLLGAGCDQQGNDQFTKLLLHADGVNGGTIKDSSAANHSFSVGGGSPAISTATKKFGTAALNLPNAAPNYVTTAASSDWEFGSAPFTLDFQVQYATWPTNTNAAAPIWSLSSANTAGGWLLIIGGNSGGTPLMEFAVFAPNPPFGQTVVGDFVAVVTPSLNVFHHFEVGRSGALWFMAQNGTSLAVSAPTNLGAGAIPTSGVALNVGNRDLTAGGIYDEMRVSKGVLRHSTSFTPPKFAYCP